MGITMTVPIRLATLHGSEEAHLLQAHGCVVAVLAYIPSENGGDGSWWLEAGFGPWAQEGLVFPTVEAAETWVRDRLPAHWKPTGT